MFKRVYGKPGTPEQPGSAGTALFLRLEHYHATDGEDFATELTQFFYYTVAFNIILIIKQLCSTHGESKYLGEH